MLRCWRSTRELTQPTFFLITWIQNSYISKLIELIMTSEYLNGERVRDVIRMLEAFPSEHYSRDEIIEMMEDMPIHQAYLQRASGAFTTPPPNTTVTIAGEEIEIEGDASTACYHGCVVCEKFSLSFVGVSYIVDFEDAETSDYAAGYRLMIKKDEDYENLKNLFVTHFNRHHREIVQKREKHVRKYEIVPREKDTVYIGTPSSLFGSSVMSGVVTSATVRSTVPEYEVVVDPETGRITPVHGRRHD